MHPRNIHINGYDYEKLATVNPSLQEYIRDNGFGRLSIDYANQDAVLALNKTLLEAYYGIKNWSIPSNALCPPVPGRADYLHHLADFLAYKSNHKQIPKGQKVRILDIGVGASAIYPILGNALYGWSFIGSDSNKASINHIEMQLKAENESLAKNLESRYQPNSKNIFTDIIHQGEFIDATICNPPFHSSAEDAERRTKRKWKQLGLKEQMQSTKSFGGQSNELWCEGGEVAFLQRMLQESVNYSSQVLWFSSLVSRKTTLALLETTVKEVAPAQFEIIEMAQGQKISRFIAWTFLDKKQHDAWAGFRF